MNEEKAALRRQVLAAEQAMTGEEKAAADGAICRRVLSLETYAHAHTVFAFVGRADEIDTRPLLEAILAAGKRLCVPLCTSAGQMECRQVTDLGALHRGAYGILEPSETAPLVEPDGIDLALVPCVTCDRHGHRLGRGGGYYDRFLARYGGKTLLLCREALLREAVPQEPHDRPVTPVVTDGGVYV